MKRTKAYVAVLASIGAGGGIDDAIAELPTDFVSEMIFETQTTATHFVLMCSPFDAEIGRTVKWIDTCNEIGRMAIDQAVAAKLIAPVAGLAFGQASAFLRDAEPGARVGATLKREFELLVPTI